MSNTSQHPYAATYVVDGDGSVRPVNLESKREEIEPLAHPEYIPMDVFVNRMTIREHFRCSSLRAERCRIHDAPA